MGEVSGVYTADCQAVLENRIPLPQVMHEIHQRPQPKRALETFLDGLNSREEFRKHRRFDHVTSVVNSTIEDYTNNPTTQTVDKVQNVATTRMPKIPDAVTSPPPVPILKTESLSSLLSEQLSRSDEVISDKVIT